MTREDAKQLLPIIQAFSEGRSIEFSSITDVSKAWREVADFPIGMIKNLKFRIKPEQKYRPFKDTEECFRDMKNHEPFGYIRQKQKGDLELIIGTLDDEYEYLKLSMSSTTKLKTVFERYTYFDGSPFGIKVEE